MTVSPNYDRERELETLYEITRTLNSTLEFDEVLKLVMDRVISFINAERGFLMLINPATGEPEFKIARDKHARTFPESAFATAQISRTTVKRAISTKQPQLTDDAQIDAAFNEQASIMAYGIRSILCAPLLVRDKCIGAVYVDSQFNVNTFVARHRDLLLAFCNQAAIAIDNARLFAQVREDKEYMDNIFGSIANGVVTIDPNGIIKTFNDAASRILRKRPEEAVGKHFGEAFKDLTQLGLVKLLQNAFTYKDRMSPGPYSMDVEIPRRTGVCHINLYVTTLRDTQGSGEYLGAALVIDDETELKRSKADAKKVKDIFERYVHPNVVQQLIRNPAALNLGGETKVISVVFADIREYTKIGERLAPEAVMNLINIYLKIMCEAIWEEEGTLTAFQGDALMAIFNAPLDQKMHPLQAVRAAWKMREGINAYQKTLPTEDRVSFGIGVNTGLATVGNVGSKARMQNYTAIGDVVNVASRIQNFASNNTILIHAQTHLHVYRYVDVDPPQQVNLKNKSELQTVYHLKGLK